MADQNSQSMQRSQPPVSRGRQSGEPDSASFALTTGPVVPHQRPGGLPGSSTGARTDPGRTGVADLTDDPTLIPPHTGY